MTCRRFGNLILFVIIDAFPAFDRPSISDCWPLFSTFVIQRYFDKLRSCFSNAKFTNFGNSRNPRVTSSSIWAQVDCPAESWKRLPFFKAQPARADGRPLQNGYWRSFAQKAKRRQRVCSVQANDTRKNRYLTV